MIYRSWAKTKLALLLIAEEQVGARKRAEVEAELSDEEAAFSEARQVMGRAR